MKKKRIAPQPKPIPFKTANFALLNGITVAKESTARSHPTPERQPQAPLPQRDTDLFRDAMRDVVPLHGNNPPVPHDGLLPINHIPATHPAEHQEDMLLFMGEIGRLKIEKRFTETFDEPPPPARSRRQRQAKRGEIKIEQRLDLHGMTREEAWDKLPRFVRSAQQQGVKTLLIITGRGNNSPEGPVLPGVVDRWLRDEGKELVVEFFPAPPALGGAGARLVFLRTPAETSSRDSRHSPSQADRE